MKNNNQTPLYSQIYNVLLKRIEDGTYIEKELLPSEASLKEEFKVSRITIRRALRDLEFAGYINIKKGKGSFVLPKNKYSNLVGVTSFSQEALKAGERPSSIILTFEEIEASSIVAKSLKLKEGDIIYHLKRLRLKNGRIIGINDQFISKKYGVKILDKNLNNKTSIYALYEKQGFHIKKATETIEATMPSTFLKKQLYIKDNMPVFHRERITYDFMDRPLELSVNYYKAEEYKYILLLKS